MCSELLGNIIDGTICRFVTFTFVMWYSLLLWTIFTARLRVKPGGVNHLCAVYVPLFPRAPRVDSLTNLYQQPRKFHHGHICVGRYRVCVLLSLPHHNATVTLALYIEVAVKKICTALLLKMTLIYLPGGKRFQVFANSPSCEVSHHFQKLFAWAQTRDSAHSTEWT